MEVHLKMDAVPYHGRKSERPSLTAAILNKMFSSVMLSIVQLHSDAYVVTTTFNADNSSKHLTPPPQK